jgi:hypothetical protein
MKKASTAPNPSREAGIGQRMIEVKLYFWTNKIADRKGQIIPKHAWGSGMVRVQSNKTHGIRPNRPIPFHSTLELLGAIEKVLIQNGIVLHPTRKMKKYTFI